MYIHKFEQTMLSLNKLEQVLTNPKKLYRKGWGATQESKNPKGRPFASLLLGGARPPFDKEKG